MTGLREGEQKQDAQWPDYMGSILRGEQPINQLLPQPAYMSEIKGLEEFRNDKEQEIMILTIPEAMRLLYSKTDNLLTTTYSRAATYYCSHSAREMAVDVLDVNKSLSDKGINIFTINDSLKLSSFSWKLTSYYNQAGDLAWKISNAFNVKAITYTANGQTYIKLTGHTGLRRILKGTRYLFNHPQILSFGIGKAGITKGIVTGTRYNIYFSGASHLLEFIFRSEYDFVDFFVDIAMDIAKIMVTEIVLKVAAGILLSTGSAVIITAVALIVLGIVSVWGLNYLDSKNVCDLSNVLKKAMRSGYDIYTQRLIDDTRTLSPWQYSLFHSSL